MVVAAVTVDRQRPAVIAATDWAQNGEEATNHDWTT